MFGTTIVLWIAGMALGNTTPSLWRAQQSNTRETTTTATTAATAEAQVDTGLPPASKQHDATST